MNFQWAFSFKYVHKKFVYSNEKDKTKTEAENNKKTALAQETRRQRIIIHSKSNIKL